jgi:predicted dehydrogenase
MIWSLENKQPADRGWYHVELPDPRRAPGGPLSPGSYDTYMFKRQMEAFIQCIKAGLPPPITGEDGRATLAVVEAAYESARLGQKVRVKYS